MRREKGLKKSSGELLISVNLSFYHST